MWDCPSLGTSLPSAIAYGGCIVWGVELSLTPGLDWAAPSDVQHGVYQLLIGDDLDTLSLLCTFLP